MIKNHKLMFGLSLFIFGIIFLSFFISGFITFYLFSIGIIKPSRYIKYIDFIPLIPLIGLLFLAFLPSVIISLVFSRKFFMPIQLMINGQKQVAAGDFSIRVNENSPFLEIRKMNRNFNKMVQELNSMEMLRSDFVQSVSHEFKTPLAAINGYSSLLSEAELPAPYNHYVDKILGSTNQLSTLTTNVLMLSKLENQTIISENNSFYLDEQIRQCFILTEHLWLEKNMEFELDLPVIKYFGNEGLMSQIWINLLTNAIKFTPEKGLISIKGIEEEDRITITIRDSGIGMPPEMLLHIFDKFYQGDKSHQQKGNGLGLSLVKKIVELCDGTITVSSEVNVGTIFTITFEKKY